VANHRRHLHPERRSHVPLLTISSLNLKPIWGQRPIMFRLSPVLLAP